MAKRRLQGTKAILSGQAGIVVLMDGSETCRYRRVGEDGFHACRPQDVTYLFGDASDAIVVIGKSPAQICRLLDNEWANDRALHLMLILVDGDAHLRAKRIAAESLEDILGNPTTYQFVTHRFYAHGLPAGADLDDAVQMSSELGRKIVWSMLIEFRNRQAAIKQVRERWELLDTGLFGSVAKKQQFEQIAIEEGMFFSLCKNAASKDEVRNWADNLRLKGFGSRMEILDAWALPFTTQRKDVAHETQASFYEIWERYAE